MTRVEIGQRIAALRKEKRWSQLVMAEKAGVSRAFVCNLERGTGNDPGLQKILKILGLFDCTLKITGADSPPTLDDLLAEQVYDNGTG